MHFDSGVDCRGCIFPKDIDCGIPGVIAVGAFQNSKNCEDAEESEDTCPTRVFSKEWRRSFLVGGRITYGIRKAKPTTTVILDESFICKFQTKKIGKMKSATSRAKLVAPIEIQPALGPRLKLDRVMPVPTVLTTPQITMAAVTVRAAMTCCLKAESRRIRSETASLEPVRAMMDKMSLARIDFRGLIVSLCPSSKEEKKTHSYFFQTSLTHVKRMLIRSPSKTMSNRLKNCNALSQCESLANVSNGQ